MNVFNEKGHFSGSRSSETLGLITKISEFEHKVANYTVRMKEKSNVLHPTGDIQGIQGKLI